MRCVVPTQRQERVGQLLRQEISHIIKRQLKDPRIGMISITDVEVTADLRHARVFASVFGSDDEAVASLAVLDGAAGFIRGELGKTVRLRYIPELEFRRDESAARGARIHELLEQVKRDSRPTEDPTDSGSDPAA
ncbi:MAG: 30S ribosome-binding factor RbfA [Armatimonadota bacterium]|nr:MAG: 30S ribosome-binding factor RbfA [Armatimonadota bacterium]